MNLYFMHVGLFCGLPYSRPSFEPARPPSCWMLFGSRREPLDGRSGTFGRLQRPKPPLRSLQCFRCPRDHTAAIWQRLVSFVGLFGDSPRHQGNSTSLPVRARSRIFSLVPVMFLQVSAPTCLTCSAALLPLLSHPQDPYGHLHWFLLLRPPGTYREPIGRFRRVVFADSLS